MLLALGDEAIGGDQDRHEHALLGDRRLERLELVGGERREDGFGDQLHGGLPVNGGQAVAADRAARGVRTSNGPAWPVVWEIGLSTCRPCPKASVVVTAQCLSTVA